MAGLEDVFGHFVALHRGEAVEEDDVVVAGRFDEFSVDLVGLEQRLALGGLRLFAHRRPDVGVYRVGALDGGLRVVGDGYRRAGLAVLRDLLALCDERGIGEEFLRRADYEVHAHLRRAYHEGVRYVVASVSDVDEANALEASEVLANREEVGEDLRWMIVVGEAVPDGDARVLREVFDYLLAESAELDAVEHAAEDARRVCDVFLMAELDVVLAEVLGMSAFVDRRDGEGAARARRGLLEDERDVLALKQVALYAGALFILEVGGKVEEIFNLRRRMVLQRDKVAVAKIHRHLDCSLHEFCIGLWFLLRF